MLGDQQTTRAYVYCEFTCGCRVQRWRDELVTRSGKPVESFEQIRHLVRCEVHDAPVAEPHGFVQGIKTG